MADFYGQDARYGQDAQPAGRYESPAARRRRTASLVALVMLCIAWVAGLAALPVVLFLVAALSIGSEPGLGGMGWLALVEVCCIFGAPLAGAVVALTSRRWLAAAGFGVAFGLAVAAVVALFVFM